MTSFIDIFIPNFKLATTVSCFNFKDLIIFFIITKAVCVYQICCTVQKRSTQIINYRLRWKQIHKIQGNCGKWRFISHFQSFTSHLGKIKIYMNPMLIFIHIFPPSWFHLSIQTDEINFTLQISFLQLHYYYFHSLQIKF